MMFASELLSSAVNGPLDGTVHERLIAEARGVPLALVELPARLTPGRLSGAFAVALSPTGRQPDAGEAPDRPSQPAPQNTGTTATRRGGTRGRPSLLWSAAAYLGISADAAGPAEAEGLLESG